MEQAKLMDKPSKTKRFLDAATSILHIFNTAGVSFRYDPSESSQSNTDNGPTPKNTFLDALASGGLSLITKEVEPVNLRPHTEISEQDLIKSHLPQFPTPNQNAEN